MDTFSKFLISLPSFPNSPIFIIILFVFPLATLFFLSIKRKLSKGINLPPSPPALPIIGNLHQLGKLPHQSLCQLSRKYGPVMLLKLGQIPTLVVSSPETVEQVLKTNDLACCSKPDSYGTNKFSYNLLDIAFSPYNDYWKEIRKLCVIEFLSVKKVQSFGHVRDAEVSKFIDSLYQVEGTPINLSERIFNATNEIICKIAFGKSYGSEQFKGSSVQQVLNECSDVTSGFWAADFFPHFGWIIDKLTGLHKKLDKSFADIDGFLERIIEDHLNPGQENVEHKDIVEILLSLSKDSTCPVHLTRGGIKALLMDIFLGGVDTNAVTVGWAMTELVKNPRVMKKAQAEIRRVIGKNNKVNEDDIKNLVYLKMILKENFRLHPPTALLAPRETMKHCKIGGYDVYPKTRILFGPWTMGRDPSIWKDPEEFYPKRFEDNNIDFKGTNFELVPFGAGRRICPGIAMAIANVELMLTNLLYHFDWELPTGTTIEDIDMEEEGGLTVHKKLPLYVVLSNINGRTS